MSETPALTKRGAKAFQKALYERSFVDFVRRAWQEIDPADYIHNWHVDVLCEHLQACAEGRINRLLVNIPPGTAKSTIANVLYPAWMWTRWPEKRIISTSHAEKLALRDSLKTKRLVESAWFQSLWPIAIRDDQKAKSKFENDSMGGREACPFSSITGSRGNCLRGDTIVQTQNGPMTIKNIVTRYPDQLVFGYDINTNRVVQRPIEAVARRSSQDFYRVHTTSGRVVEATGNHRIYTQRGWIEARLLSTGDSLVRMLPKASGADGSGDEKDDRSNGGLLLPQMLDNGDELASRAGAGLPDLRVTHLQAGSTGREGAVLFEALSDGSQGAKGFEFPDAGDACAVRDVRDRVPTGFERERESLLLANVQGHRALTRYDGQGQSAMAGWQGLSAPDGGKRVSGDTSVHSGPGQSDVRDLSRHGHPSCPPHRSGHYEQRTGEFDNSLRAASYPVARGGALDTVSDTVARVERVSEETDVYDIQVAGVRNFFANDILVHNCVIVDDPHSVDDAKSAAYRNSAVDTFLSAIPSRLNDLDNDCIIVIMQRLHEDDVSGAILSRPDLGYTHLCLPLFADDEEDRVATSIGWVDHRKKGENLFPAKFSEKAIKSLRASLGPLQFAGQYQQRPAPDEDGFFQRKWFKTFKESEIPKHIHHYMTSDHAPSGNNDFNVFRIWGVDSNRTVWLIDSFRERCTMDKALGISREQSGRTIISPQGAFALIKKYQPLAWFPENDGTWAAIRSMVEATMIETGLFVRIQTLPTKGAGDKMGKAVPYQAMAAMGQVRMIEGPISEDALAEYSMFPAGKRDDQVDADSAIARALAELIPAYIPEVEEVRKRSMFDDDDEWSASDSVWA